MKLLGDVPVKQYVCLSLNDWLSKRVSHKSSYIPSLSIVIANHEPVGQARIPTTPGLIVGIIGHKVSSMEIGREHKRNVHNPVNDSLGLRSKLYERLERKRTMNWSHWYALMTAKT